MGKNNKGEDNKRKKKVRPGKAMRKRARLFAGLELKSSQEQPQKKDQIEIGEEQQNQDEVQKQVEQKVSIEQERRDGSFELVAGEAWVIRFEVGKFYKMKIKDIGQRTITVKAIDSQEQIFVNGKISREHILTLPTILSAIRKGNKKPDAQSFTRSLPSLSISQQQQFSTFISQIQFQRETILLVNFPVQIENTTTPWQGLPSCAHNSESLMVVGTKNTGKSTLCDYLLNIQDAAVLDCDIGRNMALEGTVSLTWRGGAKQIWIGEFTPLNNLQTYLKAIRHLLQLYNRQHFTKKLILNTMGYLTGLGELLLYEIYHIAKPAHFLVIETPSQNYKRSPLWAIRQAISSGQYIERLHLSQAGSSQLILNHKTSCSFHHYINPHSHSKMHSPRFQHAFHTPNRKITNISDLLLTIFQSQTRQGALNSIQRQKLQIYEQSRHFIHRVEAEWSGRQYIKMESSQSIDMRLVILGRTQREGSGLLEAQAVGFCWRGRIYYRGAIQFQVGIVSEGVDFQKGFYTVNEAKMVQLQLGRGRIKHLIANIQALGSKGMRNNPSKRM